MNALSHHYCWRVELGLALDTAVVWPTLLPGGVRPAPTNCACYAELPMCVVVQDLTPAAVIPALEANLVASWCLFSRLPGAELHDTPDLLWVATDIPFAPFNGVLRTRLPPEAVDAAITTTLQHYSRRQVPMLWLVTPGTHPPDLGQHLVAHGLIPVVDDPGMALDLHALPTDLPTPAGFTVAQVDDLASLQAWASFAGQPEVADALVAWGSAVGFAAERELYLYLGLLEGRPVATASLVLAAGVAGLYSVMTLPEVQRRGIGTLMTVVPLRAARARGYRVGVLQSSPMGLSLYRRLGFQEYCRIAGYLWQGTGTGVQTPL
jgi:ribosomal protein S18 acetylase RimI-like enzyme